MISTDERDKHLEKLEDTKIKLKYISKRNNPITINPAIKGEHIQIRINRETALFDDIKEKDKILKIIRMIQHQDINN